MTIAERNEIFAKEVLTIVDIQRLFDVDYTTASGIIRQIRRKFDRLKKQGKVHVQDYIDYFGLDVARYCIPASSGEEHSCT